MFENFMQELSLKADNVKVQNDYLNFKQLFDRTALL